MNDITHKNNYVTIFQTNLNELLYVISAFFITMTVLYTLEYYNTRYAKTLLESEDYKELYKVMLINALSSIIVVLYMVFSRSLNWKIAIMNILTLFVLAFITGTLAESSGFNRYLNRAETKNGVGNYAKLDQKCENDTIDESINFEYSKTHPFLKSFIRTTFVFAGVYFALKILTLIKCVYLGYIDKKGLTHINNRLFFNGKINPNVGFGLELVVISIISTMSFYLKQKFCDVPGSHTNINSLLIGIVMSIVTHVSFQYTGMFGTN